MGLSEEHQQYVTNYLLKLQAESAIYQDLCVCKSDGKSIKVLVVATTRLVSFHVVKSKSISLYNEHFWTELVKLSYGDESSIIFEFFEYTYNIFSPDENPLFSISKYLVSLFPISMRKDIFIPFSKFDFSESFDILQRLRIRIMEKKLSSNEDDINEIIKIISNPFGTTIDTSIPIVSKFPHIILEFAGFFENFTTLIVKNTDSAAIINEIKQGSSINIVFLNEISHENMKKILNSIRSSKLNNLVGLCIVATIIDQNIMSSLIEVIKAKNIKQIVFDKCSIRITSSKGDSLLQYTNLSSKQSLSYINFIITELASISNSPINQIGLKNCGIECGHFLCVISKEIPSISCIELNGNIFEQFEFDLPPNCEKYSFSNVRFKNESFFRLLKQLLKTETKASIDLSSIILENWTAALKVIKGMAADGISSFCWFSNPNCIEIAKFLSESDSINSIGFSENLSNLFLQGLVFQNRLKCVSIMKSNSFKELLVFMNRHLIEKLVFYSINFDEQNTNILIEIVKNMKCLESISFENVVFSGNNSFSRFLIALESRMLYMNISFDLDSVNNILGRNIVFFQTNEIVKRVLALRDLKKYSENPNDIRIVNKPILTKDESSSSYSIEDFDIKTIKVTNIVNLGIENESFEEPELHKLTKIGGESKNNPSKSMTPPSDIAKFKPIVEPKLQSKMSPKSEVIKTVPQEDDLYVPSPIYWRPQKKKKTIPKVTSTLKDCNVIPNDTSSVFQTRISNDYEQSLNNTGPLNTSVNETNDLDSISQVFLSSDAPNDTNKFVIISSPPQCDNKDFLPSLIPPKESKRSNFENSKWDLQVGEIPIPSCSYKLRQYQKKYTISNLLKKL